MLLFFKTRQLYSIKNPQRQSGLQIIKAGLYRPKLGPKEIPCLESLNPFEIYHGVISFPFPIPSMLCRSSMAAQSFKTLSPFLLSPIRSRNLRSVFLSSNTSLRFSHSASSFSPDELPCASTSTSKSVRLYFLLIFNSVT